MRFAGILLGLIALSSSALAQEQKLTHIQADKLPPPYDTPSANNGPIVTEKPEGATLRAPSGFKVEVYASRLNNPRWCGSAPNGDVFVAESGAGRIVVLREEKGAGKAFAMNVFADNLDYPFGILFHKGYLYIGCRTYVARVPYKSGQTKNYAPLEKILTGLPEEGHKTRALAYNPRNNKMYIVIGSSKDIGEETDNRRATICEFDPDGANFRIFATGLRNACGMSLNPANGELWTAVNERDGLGDDTVPDYATSVKEGGFYGWPYYYAGKYQDPRMPAKPELREKSLVPDVLLNSHVASLGLTFYTGKQFPKEYQGDLFVAQHGSGNRMERVGYDIVRVPFKNGKPVGGFAEFVGGWMLDKNKRQVWGRPVGVFMANDGALLVTDDGNNTIWRISYAP